MIFTPSRIELRLTQASGTAATFLRIFWLEALTFFWNDKEVFIGGVQLTHGQGQRDGRPPSEE
jgi:hypothetical protein